jgi:hypothetical protein
MHFEPGGASPYTKRGVHNADAQSARGAMHKPEQRARKVQKTMALDGFLVAPKA